MYIAHRVITCHVSSHRVMLRPDSSRLVTPFVRASEQADLTSDPRSVHFDDSYAVCCSPEGVNKTFDFTFS